MSEVRTKVLADIRASLNRSAALDKDTAAGLDDRTASAPVVLKPAFDAEPIALFVEKLGKVNATVDRIDDIDGVSEAVGRHLRTYGLDERFVVAPDPELEPVRWSNRFQIERRAATGTDSVSVTSAFAGVAETGSCMLLSGAASPTTLNFLPDDHIVVLRASRIVMHLEDAWAMLRKARVSAAAPAGFSMPRTVNLISGPSKTADIELTMREGAHGPRRLHIVLIGN